MRKKTCYSTVTFLVLARIGCLGQAAAPSPAWNDTGISQPAFSKIPFQETAGVIEILPGMWVKSLGYQGHWNPVRYRGGGFSQTVFLVNGVNFNDPWTGMPDWNFLPEAWLDSIKCHSATNPFGSAAVGAVIDAATGRELAQRPLTRIAYSRTGDGFSRTCASFSKAVSDRLTFRAAAAFRNYGETAAPPASDDVTVHGQARFRLSRDWRMEYFFGRSDAESDLDFPSMVPGDTAVTWRALFERKQTHHIVTVSGGFLNTRLSLRRGSYKYAIDGFSGLSVPRTSVQLEQSSNPGIPLSWGFQCDWDALKQGGFNSNSRWTGGAFAGAHAPVFGNVSAGAQAGVHFSKNGGTRLQGSFRLDWAGADGLAAWMSVHQGIRDPALGEWTGLSFSPFPSVTPEDRADRVPEITPESNRSLRPERSVNAEAGLETHRASWLKARLCAFGRRVEDTIERSVSGGFVNGGALQFLGAESSIELGPWFGVSALASVNYLNAENEQGSLLFDRPNFYGSGHLTWRGSLFQDDLAIAVSMRLRSWSEFWNSLYGYETASSVLLPYATLMDVRFSATVMKKAAVYWMMENAVGTRAWSVAGHPLPIRLATFGLTWELLD